MKIKDEIFLEKNRGDGMSTFYFSFISYAINYYTIINSHSECNDCSELTCTCDVLVLFPYQDLIRTIRTILPLHRDTRDILFLFNSLNRVSGETRRASRRNGMV